MNVGAHTTCLVHLHQELREQAENEKKYNTHRVVGSGSEESKNMYRFISFWERGGQHSRSLATNDEGCGENPGACELH